MIAVIVTVAIASFLVGVGAAVIAFHAATADRRGGYIEIDPRKPW